jgi:hypothetical protein
MAGPGKYYLNVKVDAIYLNKTRGQNVLTDMLSNIYEVQRDLFMDA